MTTVEEIKSVIEKCSPDQKLEILRYLRKYVPIHPIEEKLNTSAEIILEAIDRASDLTLRGIRGIIAEAAFKKEVVDYLTQWKDVSPGGDQPFDFLLRNDIRGEIKIQVKMQRLKAHHPMMANEGYFFLSKDKFVVETQKTRGGTDAKTGEDTRAYRFGEFDILAVSLHPSTNNWNNFIYTVADWLLPRTVNKKDSGDSEKNSKLILKFQPVPKESDEYWTTDIETCINWFFEKISKTIPL